MTNSVAVCNASIVVMALSLAGCGGASVVVAEGTRAASCEALEMAVEHRHGEGDITDEQARQELGCIRRVCDQLHVEITDGD